jgi:hypothetical protein
MRFDTWGAHPHELERELACDAHIDRPDQRLVRAVEVPAPAATVFRWLCQLRIAPYSYDWIDNWGRRSPRELTPGLERLAVGDRFMTVFRLVDFEPDRSITLVHDGPLFGRVVVTYEVTPKGTEASRLFARLLVRYRRGPLRGLALLLPPGDAIMMRKQLLTLRDLAAASAPAPAPEPERPIHA